MKTTIKILSLVVWVGLASHAGAQMMPQQGAVQPQMQQTAVQPQASTMNGQVGEVNNMSQANIIQICQCLTIDSATNCQRAFNGPNNTATVMPNAAAPTPGVPTLNH